MNAQYMQHFDVFFSQLFGLTRWKHSCEGVVGMMRGGGREVRVGEGTGGDGREGVVVDPCCFLEEYQRCVTKGLRTQCAFSQ